MPSDRPNRPRYAARLNAFKAAVSGGPPTIADLLARAGEVPGLNAADLNYPDHFTDHSPAEVSELLAQSRLALNGLAMRYYTDPGFRLGAFTHPDRSVRRAAYSSPARHTGTCEVCSTSSRSSPFWSRGVASR